jgi:DNA-binding response OmpR family regulator
VVEKEHFIVERSHAMPEGSQAASTLGMQPAAVHTRARGIILVIEDDLPIREVLTDVFTDAGYQVVGTDLGGEGLMLIETAAPQLVTLDLMLPDVRGEHVLEKIRQYRATHALPVIIISAASNVSSDVHELSDAVLPKPFDHDLLLSTIGALIPADTPPLADEPIIARQVNT